jgi:hypothetical protein
MVWRDVLNSAGAADESARHLLSLLSDPEAIIEIDLRDVSRMTPSFANTLVMRLLAVLPKADLRTRCVFVDPPAHVAAALRLAVERYESGIRLSDQPAPAEAHLRSA